MLQTQRRGEQLLLELIPRDQALWPPRARHSRPAWLLAASRLCSWSELDQPLFPAPLTCACECVCVCVCYMTIEGAISQLPGILATAASPEKACSSWSADDSAAWALWPLADPWQGRQPRALAPLFGSVLSRWHQQMNSWILLLALALESNQK